MSGNNLYHSATCTIHCFFCLTNFCSYQSSYQIQKKKGEEIRKVRIVNKSKKKLIKAPADLCFEDDFFPKNYKRKLKENFGKNMIYAVSRQTENEKNHIHQIDVTRRIAGGSVTLDGPLCGFPSSRKREKEEDFFGTNDVLLFLNNILIIFRVNHILLLP